MNNKNNQAYFDVVIENLNTLYKINEESIKKGKMPERIPINKLALFGIKSQQLITSYSRGDTLNELRNQYTEVVHIMNEVWDKRAVKMHMGREQKEMDVYYLDKYIYMRWMLSLGVLLEIADEEFDILVALIIRDSIKDYMYDFLITSRRNKWTISEAMNIQKPKNNIKEIIFETNPEKCQKMIKKYLEKEWLKTYKNFGLDKAHLEIDKGYYYGQWAFEVAAVVKMKGLDDSSFRDNQFYPARLLHQN